jgi:hypothetical protein
MLEFKPDFEKTMQRMEAFWNRGVLDRPLIQFSLYKPPAEWVPYPAAKHTSPAGRWQDAQYQAEFALADLSNRLFMGDTLPIAWPNLGPDVFASFYGCPLRYGDYGTSWSEPVLTDWNQAPALQFDWYSPTLARLLEMTDALLAVGQGKFITGMSDWHPGGDCLAALRDPQNLALDLFDHPDEVRELLMRVEADYFKLYDLFYHKLSAAGQPITAWLTLTGRGRYYIPSNDFSGMISTRQLRAFFLEGTRRECQALDHSIYHLDGPAALRHLDALLELPELDAIQYVPTTGSEAFERWAPVYQRIQAAGKALQVSCQAFEIDLVKQALRPGGLYLAVSGVASVAQAEDLLHKLEHWEE